MRRPPGDRGGRGAGTPRLLAPRALPLRAVRRSLTVAVAQARSGAASSLALRLSGPRSSSQPLLRVPSRSWRLSGPSEAPLEAVRRRCRACVSVRWRTRAAGGASAPAPRRRLRRLACRTHRSARARSSQHWRRHATRRPRRGARDKLGLMRNMRYCPHHPHKEGLPTCHATRRTAIRGELRHQDRVYVRRPPKREVDWSR